VTAMKIKLITILLVVALGGCSSSHAFHINKESRAEVAKEERINFKIGVAMGADGGMGDNTFHAIAFQGFNQYADRYPLSRLQCSQAKTDKEEDLLHAVRELAVIKSDIIFGLGAAFTEIFEKLHPQYPHIKFVLLGGNIINPSENLLTVDFLDQQSSFLAGVAAALTTKTGAIGFLGGQELEGAKRQQLWFEAGIRYANLMYGTMASLEQVSFTHSFTDRRLGQKLARDIYLDGVDVLFACAGASGSGAMDEAKVLVEKGGEVWLIGMDNDQFLEGEIFSGGSVVLTSAVKHLDIAIYEILELYVRGHFPAGGHWVKGLHNHGVGLPKNNPNFSQMTVERVRETEEKILEENLLIPFGPGDLEKMLELPLIRMGF